MVKMVRLFALVVAVAAFVSVAKAEDKKPANKTGDVVTTAAGNKNFSTLVAAVKAADLVDALKGKGPFTVFAPVNKAFDAVGEEKIKALLKDKEKLGAILKYHVLAGKVEAKDALKAAVAGKSVKTLQGSEIKLSVKEVGKKKYICLNGTAKVIGTVQVSNGVIHIIDAVILPPAK